MSRVDWSVFAAVNTLLNKTPSAIDLIQDYEYMRELYQLAIVDDLSAQPMDHLNKLKT